MADISCEGLSVPTPDPLDPKPHNQECARFPEGKERLFALSETSAKSISNQNCSKILTTQNNSRLSQFNSSCTNLHKLRKSLRVPKMGLRDVRQRQQNANSNVVGSQPANINAICTSEQSLPDRLSQALRGLSAGFRLSSHQENSGLIPADDLVYYPSQNSGTEISPNRLNDFRRSSENVSATPPKLGRLPSNIQSPPRSVQTPGRPTSRGNNQIPGTSLEQLRQMYKSLPDCSTLGRSYGDEFEEPTYCRITPLEMNVDNHPYAVNQPPPPINPRSLAANNGALIFGLMGCGETSTDESLPPQEPIIMQKPPWRENRIPDSQATYANVDKLKVNHNRNSMANTNSTLFSSFDSHGLQSSCESVGRGGCGSSDTGGSSPTDSGYRSVSRHLLELEQQRHQKDSIVSTPEVQPNGSCRVFVNGNTPPSDDRLRPCVAPKPTPRISSKFEQRTSTTNYATPASTATSSSRLAERRPNITASPISVDVHKQSSKIDTDASNKSKLNGDMKISPSGESIRLQNGSFDTINTNVSLPEEFSLERCPKLVEVDRPPWDERTVVTVLQRGRTKDLVHRIAVDAVPRLTYLLQRPLVRLTRELFRLSQRLGKSTSKDVQSAVKIILPTNLAESCMKAGIQATSLYSMGSAGDSVKQSKSRRAALRLSVGRFHRWLCDAQPSVSIHEQSSVFMTAVCECILEEMVLQCIPCLDSETMLTCESLALALASNSDLWGLLQPYEHLISSRTANGVLSLPSFFASANASREGSRRGTPGLPPRSSVPLKSTELEQSLLATCVGNIQELAELIYKLNEEILSRTGHQPGVRGSQASLAANASFSSKSSGGQRLPQGFVWSHDALEVLFYFMRCSQLEHSDDPNGYNPPVRLAHERPYLVLPPLCDWMRVSQSFSDHRCSNSVDGDDVRQAARVLLPALDCPPRGNGAENIASSTWKLSAKSCTTRFKQHLAFQILETGRMELYPQALQLLGPQKYNSYNSQGLTPLILSCLRGDEMTAMALLESGADPNIPVPINVDSELYPQLIPEFAGWTALTFAVAKRHISLVRILLDKYSEVEMDFMLTDTPLQMAAMSGVPEIVSLLLGFGADAFKSTMDLGNGTSFAVSYKQRGSPCPLTLASAHGQRNVVHSMLQQGRNRSKEEQMSLEDFLKEGHGTKTSSPGKCRNALSDQTSNKSDSSAYSWSKKELKSLQEAMYCAAECRHLELTMDFRNLGIPWNIHVWGQTLAACQEFGDRALIQQLLEDFIDKNNKFIDEITIDFVDDTLPLLFDIFRHTKNSAISNMLAQILCNLFGEQEPQLPQLENTINRVAAIDPSFVNNPELSDVTFLIQGQTLYAHRIVLVNASPRFKKLLGKSEKEIVIEDIGYRVFELMMEYLYRGNLIGSEQICQSNWMNLLSAANQFQLVGLSNLAQCKLCSSVNYENSINMYRFANTENAPTLQSFCCGFFISNLRRLMSDKSEVADEFRKIIHASRRHQNRSFELCSKMITVLTHRIEQKLAMPRKV